MLETLSPINKGSYAPDDRIPMLRALIGEIRLVHDALASKLDEGVNVNNLDVVEASLHNELSSTTKQLLAALKDLKKVTEAQTKALEDGFKNKEGPEKVIVENLKDSPTDIKVNNLSELDEQFKKIQDAIKGLKLEVNVPESVVNVPAPVVNIPEHTVNVPAPIVNVPEVDLGPVVRELDIQLNKIRTNSVSRPLAVRLTNGQEWINQLTLLTEKTREAFAAYPGPLQIKNAWGATVNPATDDTLSLLTKNYATIIRSSGNYIYIGNALMGTASSAATWRVKRLDTTTLLDIKWADGDDAYNNVFDDYASLTYA